MIERIFDLIVFVIFSFLDNLIIIGEILGLFLVGITIVFIRKKLRIRSEMRKFIQKYLQSEDIDEEAKNYLIAGAYSQAARRFHSLASSSRSLFGEYMGKEAEIEEILEEYKSAYHYFKEAAQEYVKTRQQDKIPIDSEYVARLYLKAGENCLRTKEKGKNAKHNNALNYFMAAECFYNAGVFFCGCQDYESAAFAHLNAIKSALKERALKNFYSRSTMNKAIWGFGEAFSHINTYIIAKVVLNEANRVQRHFPKTNDYRDEGYPEISTMSKELKNSIIQLKVKAQSLRQEEHSPQQTAIEYHNQGNHRAAAQLYEKHNQWQEAAEEYEHAQDFLAAAKIFEKLNQWQDAALQYERAQDYQAAAKIYADLKQWHEAAINHEKAKNHLLARKMFLTALQQFQDQHRLAAQPLDRQITLYQDYLRQFPQNFLANSALAQCYLRQADWNAAFEQLQQLVTRNFPNTQAKTLLLRAQCYFGRAQGADIRLGLQDVEQVIAHHQDAPVSQELLDMAAQLRDAEYLRNTGTQDCFPREYERVLTLLSTDIERRFKAAVKAGNADDLLDIALQLWRIGYHDLTVKLLDELGKGAEKEIAQDVAVAKHVMATADAYWKRAQEQPEMAVYDAIAERLWQAAATALAKQLPLAKISAQNVESYYLLFKAYQALRDLRKCEEVGLKILGVTGFEGYKDVRPIVDNLIAGGFEARQERRTGEGAATQPGAMTGRAEQFVQYRGVFHTKGGMGEIYKGAAPDGSPVAIKRLLRYAGNDGWSRRFMREMQVVRQLRHPHIVTVLDVNEQEGYYVMEWADGGTLDDLLNARKTLPPADALRIAADIADALDAAHQQGIIHRDIKPSNILLFSNYGAKLTDFGIAHIETDTRLTDSGQHPGTPRYMSPEQCMGAAITHKTDMFSLGLVLHEALTGDIPNRAEFVQKDSEEIVTATTFPFPEEIRNIVVKCLRTNDNRRCSASELRADLQRMAAMTLD